MIGAHRFEQAISTLATQRLCSSTNHQPTVWRGVLTDCGTVGGMDAAIEPHGRVHGVSRER
ncbi:hypothetical protein WAU26_21040 [Xanthomonas phaseoli pv. dieffenbachiae]